jgi:hypothetical protein
MLTFPQQVDVMNDLKQEWGLTRDWGHVYCPALGF